MSTGTSTSSSSIPATSSLPTATSTTAAASTTTSPPSSATPTSTTNAATSSALTSATAATSASSAQTTSALSSSTTTTTTTPAVSSQAVVTSGGVVETVTTYITPTEAATATPSSTSTSSSNSFFSNTKAVIGVFTVVGVVVVALIVALVVNAIRRRRAQKFDRDVAEAAAEAVATSRSPFDDYGYNTGSNNGTGGGGGGGGYGYPADSHGTYTLPPMQPNDTYGMSEMSQYDLDPYAANASMAAVAAVERSRSRKDSEPGTPGIAGVGARGLAREPSKRAPYHAFAGPPPELQTSSGTMRSIRGTNQDVLEAVGLAGPARVDPPAAATTTNPSGAFVTRKPSETTQNTHASGRSQFGSMSGHHPTPLQPGYPQRRESRSPDPFAAVYPAATSASAPFPNPYDAALSSPSLPGHQSDHNEDSTELGSSSPLRSEEQRMSYQDDTDYSQGHRVLRVANE